MAWIKSYGKSRYKSINNDWLVRDASDKFRVWTESGHHLGRKKYPLLAVLRIFKARSTQIKLISQKETCKYLMDAIFENDFQRCIKNTRVRIRWFRMAAEVSRGFRGWHLTFQKNKSIIKKMQDIFEDPIG